MSLSPRSLKTMKFIIDYVEKILPGGGNKEMYVELFKKMDDKAFSVYMENVRKRGTLDMVVPPLGKVKMDVERNLKIAKEIGHNFFERIETKKEGISYLSNNKYMILRLPVRRQSQHSVKGVSYATDNNTIDFLSGQATGSSKAARISYPEVQLLNGMNMPATITELMKVRGGDLGSFNFYRSSLSKTGKVSLTQAANASTGVESTKTLSAFLTSAHLRNNL